MVLVLVGVLLWKWFQVQQPRSHVARDLSAWSRSVGLVGVDSKELTASVKSDIEVLVRILPPLRLLTRLLVGMLLLLMQHHLRLSVTTHGNASCLGPEGGSGSHIVQFRLGDGFLKIVRAACTVEALCPRQRFRALFNPPKPALHLGGCCHLELIHISNFSKLASCS